MITKPPKRIGTAEEQIANLYNYVSELASQLSFDLEERSAAGVWAESERAMRGGSEKAGSTAAVMQSSLRSMIIKTAGEVFSEDNEATREFKGKYVAVSDFGQYTQSLTAKITENSAGITQLYRYTSNIRSEFSDFDTESETYIKTGLLYYEGVPDVPIYGVGVGDIKTTVKSVGGNEETIIDKGRTLATFTSDKISFWDEGEEVAYISSKKLHMPSAEITGGTLNINNNFLVASNGDMTANNATISGEINANSGSIGGFDIGENALSYGGQIWNGGRENGIYIGTSGIQCGRNFKVTSSGNVSLTNSTFTSETLVNGVDASVVIENGGIKFKTGDTNRGEIKFIQYNRTGFNYVAPKLTFTGDIEAEGYVKGLDLYINGHSISSGFTTENLRCSNLVLDGETVRIKELITSDGETIEVLGIGSW